MRLCYFFKPEQLQRSNFFVHNQPVFLPNCFQSIFTIKMLKRKADTSSDKPCDKRLCIFRSEFTSTWNCIIPVKDDNTKALCTIFKTDFSIGHQGKADVRRHIQGAR